MMKADELFDRMYAIKASFQQYKGFAEITRKLVLTDSYPAYTASIQINLEAGSTVRIVMVSRFGDFGITHDLNREHGYAMRTSPEDGLLTNCRFGKERHVFRTVDFIGRAKDQSLAESVNGHIDNGNTVVFDFDGFRRMSVIDQGDATLFLKFLFEYLDNRHAPETLSLLLEFENQDDDTKRTIKSLQSQRIVNH
jgi:hypothetical protein